MISTIFFFLILGYFHFIFAITVTSSNNNTKHVDNNTKSDNVTDLRTERLRRLIPYMTYYIPTNGYENIDNQPNQGYNFISLGKQKHEYSDQYLENLDNKDPNYKTPEQSDYQSYSKYQQNTVRQNVAYNSVHQEQPHHQSARPVSQSSPQQYPIPQSTYNEQDEEKTPIFKASNKSPGPFQPMFVNKNELNYPYQIKLQPTVTSKPEPQDFYKLTPR